MSLPVPPVHLNGTCSTIYNNTLYSYSSSAFQSLPLVHGAEWSQLPMGEPVTGAVCVQGTPTDGKTPIALYIVGGKSNSPEHGYEGLQRYVFSSGQWESISPTTAVTQNRLYHNAVYLNDSASILVYAGTQDDTMQDSSQTFTISTTPPYTVLAFESAAPPAMSPLLMQWSDSEAVMIGGGDTNKQVMFFNPLDAWTDSGIILAQPLKNMTMVKAVIINGDDGSKNLFTFDMTVAPNQVNRTVLVDGNGNPISNATPVPRSLGKRHTRELATSSSMRVRRGSLTADSWPPYNSTFVSTTTRQDYAIANNQSGLVVLSGGVNSDEISIFSARDNCWLDPSSELAQVSVQDPNTTSSPTRTASISPLTSTPSTSTANGDSTSATSNTSSNTSPNTSSNTSSLRILGAVLGSIVGVAILLLLILLLFRRCRKRRDLIEAGHQRRSSGIPGEEKDPFDFSDRGINFRAQLNGNYGHSQQASQGSFSSVAILMGKVGKGQKLSVLGRRKGSDDFDSSSKKHKTAISNPIPQFNLAAPGSGDKGVSFAQDRPIPRTRTGGTGRRGSTRRSSGWNRYWSDGSATNILGFGARRTASNSSTSNWTASQYSEGQSNAAHLARASAIVPPLSFANPAGRLSRVASSSPTIAHADSDFPLREGIAGQIERSGSLSSSSSYNDRQDAFSSGIPASVNEDNTWTPFGENDWLPTREHDAYSEGNYGIINPRGTIVRDSTSTQWPHFPNDRSALPPSDMSWLNLGGTDRRV